MVKSLENVLDALPRMTQKELRELNARTSMLLTGATAAPGKRERLDVSGMKDTYTVLADELKKWGANPVPYVALARGKMFPVFRDAVPLLQEYVTTNMKPKNEGVRRRAVRIILGLVVQHVHAHCRAPLSTVTALRALPNFGAIIERQFPGYAEAGLLPIILNNNGTPDTDPYVNPKTV